jgi:hypothetical protein
MHQVLCSIEGLVGHGTSLGWHIDTIVPFVALPSRRALRHTLIVKNPANGLTVEAVVLDVGPWNEDDDAYVFGDSRPLSEQGTGKYRSPTNHSGIDLGEYVRLALKVTGNTQVAWAFSTFPNM